MPKRIWSMTSIGKAKSEVARKEINMGSVPI
jgi:hypothetical protein